MSKIVDEIVEANKKYVSTFGNKKDLALPPARGFAILTCMDARLDPAKYAGLSEGDAHVIRYAGGRAGSGICSLTIWRRRISMAKRGRIQTTVMDPMQANL
jgi:carbonic anhydrase